MLSSKLTIVRMGTYLRRSLVMRSLSLTEMISPLSSVYAIPLSLVGLLVCFVFTIPYHTDAYHTMTMLYTTPALSCVMYWRLIAIKSVWHIKKEMTQNRMSVRYTVIRRVGIIVGYNLAKEYQDMIDYYIILLNISI